MKTLEKKWINKLVRVLIDVENEITGTIQKIELDKVHLVEEESNKKLVISVNKITSISLLK